MKKDLNTLLKSDLVKEVKRLEKENKDLLQLSDDFNEELKIEETKLKESDTKKREAEVEVGKLKKELEKRENYTKQMEEYKDKYWEVFNKLDSYRTVYKDQLA